MKKILRFIAVWGLMALASGCSMKRIAVNKPVNALASGGSTFEGDEDPDLVATLAATAAAQPAKPLANWANLNQLVTGAEIRVTLANGKTLRGFMQRVTPESLAINATTSQETLSRQDIRRVDLKRPGHRRRNTLIGLAIGTGTGLAVGAGLDSQSRGPYDLFSNSGKVFLWPVGALVGTVIGVALPTGGWREVYRAP
jgi:hypothetical protein